MTAKTNLKSAARPLPADLAAVALIDASTCAAPGDMSVSWWHAEVAASRAPQPVVRMPRCTRWRLADVRAFWVAFAARAASDPQVAQVVTAKAKKASVAAQVKRQTLQSAASAEPGANAKTARIANEAAPHRIVEVAQ